MKKISEKFNLIFEFIYRHKFWTSIILCAVSSAVYLSVNGFLIFTGNDDYCVFKVINGGNVAIPCLGMFLTSISAALQSVIPHLNVFMMLQELICFFGVVSVNYFFIAKLGAKKGLFYAVIFDIVYMSFLVVSILFTYTAVTASVAGILCILYAGMYEKRKKTKILQIICGFLFLFFGSEARFAPFESCCAICFLMIVGVFFAAVLKRRKELGLKQAFVSIFKKYFVTGALLLAAVVSIFGVNMLSGTLKYSDSRYKEFVEYNEALAAISDAPLAISYYNTDLQKYGLKSGGDLKTLRTWFFDEDFFTLDKLKKIGDFMNKDYSKKSTNKSFFDHIISSFERNSSAWFESGVFLLYILFLIVVVFGVIITSILFPYTRGLLCRIGLLAVLCSMFFAISDVIEGNTLVLPLMAVALIICVRYDFYQAIVTFMLMTGVMALYAFMLSYRYLFHSIFAIVFPAFVFLIYAINSENLVKIKKRVKLSKVLISGVALALVAVSVFSGVKVFNNQTRVKDNESNVKLEQYVYDNPDKVFLLNNVMLMSAYYNPVFLPREKKNVVNYGLWLTQAEYFKKCRERNGIKHLFKDSINSNMYIIVYEEKVPKSFSALQTCYSSYLKEYYNNHYAEKGKEIVMKRAGRVGHYSLFKVVSQKAEKK